MAALVPLVLGYMALASGTVKAQHMLGIKYTPRQMRVVPSVSSLIRSTCRMMKHAFSRAHYRGVLHKSEDEPETFSLQHFGQARPLGAWSLSQAREPLQHLHFASIISMESGDKTLSWAGGGHPRTATHCGGIGLTLDTRGFSQSFPGAFGVNPSWVSRCHRLCRMP